MGQEGGAKQKGGKNEQVDSPEHGFGAVAAALEAVGSGTDKKNTAVTFDPKLR